MRTFKSQPSATAPLPLTSCDLGLPINNTADVICVNVLKLLALIQLQSFSHTGASYLNVKTVDIWQLLLQKCISSHQQISWMQTYLCQVFLAVCKPTTKMSYCAQTDHPMSNDLLPVICHVTVLTDKQTLNTQFTEDFSQYNAIMHVQETKIISTLASCHVQRNSSNVIFLTE